MTGVQTCALPISVAEASGQLRTAVPWKQEVILLISFVFVVFQKLFNQFLGLQLVCVDKFELNLKFY